jgi:hypothetical protein
VMQKSSVMYSEGEKETNRICLRRAVERSTRGYHKLYCTVLYCTVLHCTAVYCTAMYCTVARCERFLPAHLLSSHIFWHGGMWSCFDLFYCVSLCSGV